MLVVFFLLGFLAQTFAQIAIQGSCPQPDPVPNFNEKQLIGEWYEWARVDNYYQPDMACGLVTYDRNKDGYLMEKYNSIIRRGGSWYYWEAKMIPRDQTPTARYTLIYPKYSHDKALNGTFVDANWGHWVLFYGCKEENGQAEEFVWIWTKNPNPEDEYVHEIANSLGKVKLSMKDLSIIDHNNCLNHN